MSNKNHAYLLRRGPAGSPYHKKAWTEAGQVRLAISYHRWRSHPEYYIIHLCDSAVEEIQIEKFYTSFAENKPPEYCNKSCPFFAEGFVAVGHSDVFMRFCRKYDKELEYVGYNNVLRFSACNETEKEDQ